METELKDLKGLLVLGKDASEDDVKDRFKELADKLFNNFYISKETDRYDFLEIEFYYYCDKHKDLNISSEEESTKNKTVVYPRTTHAGDLFIHLSGIDIAFESNESNYGGILIRSLLKTDKEQNTQDVIAGPLLCSHELINNTAHFLGDKREHIKLEECSNMGVTLSVATRQGISNGAEYCYYVRERSGSNIEWKGKNGKKPRYYNAKPWNRK